MAIIKKTAHAAATLLRRWPLVCLFFLFLAVFTVADLLTPDKDISELENRPLTQAPSFNTASFLGEGQQGFQARYNGFASSASNWTLTYNEYVKDQVPLRDDWVSLHATLELAQGKLENGGIWWSGENGYQIAKDEALTPTQERTLPINAEAIGSFASRYPGRVSVMVVPSPANTLSEFLPYSPHQINEDALLDEAFVAMEAAGARVIDLRPEFNRLINDDLYYYTDHHWTTLGGAWVAYNAYCDFQGLDTVMPPANLLKTAPGFLGTNFARSMRPGTGSETIYYYDFPNSLTVYTYGSDGQLTASDGPLMDTAKFDTFDKYSAFLRGNNGYSVIEGNGAGSVLLVKDSYGNCFAPYLIENYAQIGIIDLRYAWVDVDAILAENGYEDILVLYSFENFSSDANVRRLMGVG